VVVVDDQHLVHAARRHGNARTEAKHGQLPIGEDDFARLPRILGDPDTVEAGEPGSRGGPSAVLTKTIGSVRYRVIVEMRSRQNHVAFVPMFKCYAR
jgi:hypothetical protein